MPFGCFLFFPWFTSLLYLTGFNCSATKTLLGSVDLYTRVDLTVFILCITSRLFCLTVVDVPSELDVVPRQVLKYCYNAFDIYIVCSAVTLDKSTYAA
jgi:hypothetical protein